MTALKPCSPGTILMIVLGILVLAPPASATTFVMMTDEALTDLSPVVVEGRIVSQAPAPDGSFPSTAYTLEVDCVLKGTVPGSTVIVEDTTSTVVTGLTPDTRYSFRVRARNETGPSAFSNVATVKLPAAAPALEKPEDLAAIPLSATEVRLRWRDASDEEQAFAVEVTSPESGGFHVVQTLAADAETTVLPDLLPGTPYTFRVQAIGDGEASEYSDEASATTRDLEEGPCAADATTLCLVDERFRLRVQWRDAVSGDTGVGHAVEIPDSDVSGLFWFFTDGNIELVVKTLDATYFTGFFWNFYGALSNVEYWITVTDTEAGESVTYHNPQHEICGFPDTRAFPRPEEPEGSPSSVLSTRPSELTGPGHGVLALPLPGVAGGGDCEPSETALCLLDDRFRVEVQWDNSRRSGNTHDRGDGMVRPVASVEGDETGFFWFFDEENIELVVKILDARVINGHFWVFYGGLSDVEYTITVTDTQTLRTLSFTNQAGDFCGDADTGTL